MVVPRWRAQKRTVVLEKSSAREKTNSSRNFFEIFYRHAAPDVIPITN